MSKLEAAVNALSFPAMAKWVGAFLMAEWLQVPSAMRTLVVLMLVDYATGLAAAWIRKELSSAQGLRGLLRKTLTIVLLVTCRYVEKAASVDLNVEQLVAFGYIINELISIVENLYKAGVPIPEQLVTALISIHRLRGATATDAQIIELDGK